MSAGPVALEVRSTLLLNDLDICAQAGLPLPEASVEHLFELHRRRFRGLSRRRADALLTESIERMYGVPVWPPRALVRYRPRRYTLMRLDPRVRLRWILERFINDLLSNL